MGTFHRPSNLPATDLCPVAVNFHHGSSLLPLPALWDDAARHSSLPRQPTLYFLPSSLVSFFKLLRPCSSALSHFPKPLWSKVVPAHLLPLLFFSFSSAWGHFLVLPPSLEAQQPFHAQTHMDSAALTSRCPRFPGMATLPPPTRERPHYCISCLKLHTGAPLKLVHLGPLSRSP